MSRYQEQHALQPEAWRQDAACRTYPTEWWYPADGMNWANTRRARRICADCPVREDCLIVALRRNEDGIWGGLNIKERRALRRSYNVQKILVCDFCRRSFEKPSDRQVVSLYCSEQCRKHRHSGNVVKHRRYAR